MEILKVLAGQPAKAQSRARRRLKQQCADVCLLLALAPQFDRILGLNLDGAERLLGKRSVRSACR
jgi:transposase